ncbi:secreted antigen 1 [Babesia caballi]|uniref:Secreted antigen 1 n=1 Tax=Babesia caballi TaxID=5871 RepID=A0AAV4M2I7_BABCB|nr:secreted antigen 1 [Babesia caballi]
MTSGSESGSCEGRQIEEPKTLKDALDFLAALGNNAALVTEVAKKLREKVTLYFNEDKLTDWAYDIKDCLTEVLGAVALVRNKIVKKDYRGNYGNYGLLENVTQCVGPCVDILLNVIPVLHVTFYYLYFRTDTTMYGRGGGLWFSYRCNDENENLYRWLNGQHANSPGYSSSSKAALLPGGYRGSELSLHRGKQIGEELADLLDSDAASGYLQYFSFTLCFNTSFSHASTAAALSVLRAFCEAVTNSTFHDSTTNHPSLKNICTQLLPNLQPLTANPTDQDASIFSLFKVEEKYEDKLKSDAYAIYVEWLKGTIPKVISTLTKMKNECSRWDPFGTPFMTGPFAYGFTFGNAWNPGERGVYESLKKLPGEITAVIGDCKSPTDGSLFALWKCLDPQNYNCPFPPSTSELQPMPKSGQAAGAAPAKDKKIEITGQTKQIQQPPLPSGEAGPAAGPTAVQAAYVASTSSGADPGAGVGASSQPTEAPTSASNSGDHGSRSQAGGPSGANSTATCSTRESFPDHTQYGSSEGSTGSAQSTHNANTDVTNSQSTITIGDATGGAAVLGGGCAALYFLNVGGIKTLITGVP